MGAAFLAFYQALVDTVAVAGIGNDEKVSFGLRGRCDDKEKEGQ